MTQYLYFDDRFKRYFVSDGVSVENETNFQRIGEVSEIVKQYTQLNRKL